MGVPKIVVDPKRNRIYVTFSGFMSLEEATQLIDEYANAISQCTPGFTVLADLSDYKPGTQEVQEMFAKGPKMAGEAGCSKVARVVPTAAPLGGMQIDRLAKETSSYPSQHFETIEEAEAYLDSG